MKFKIEQLALCPPDAAAARKLLTEMGAGAWARDHVVAHGTVFGEEAENEAELSFEYGLLTTARELEVLDYTRGENWMVNSGARASHLGMHCEEQELEGWREFFAARGIPVAQEVRTSSHSNPNIAGQRWYHYVIFATFAILGIDVKFIVRRDEL